jgi:hypothetical protein
MKFETQKYYSDYDVNTFFNFANFRTPDPNLEHQRDNNLVRKQKKTHNSVIIFTKKRLFF